jgi:hypothetical protein
MRCVDKLCFSNVEGGKVKVKAIPVAPTFSLDNRLTDGGKVVSLTRRLSLIPQEDSWYSFLLEAESTPRP